MMRKLIFFFTLLIFSPAILMARHVIGGEMFYEFVSNNADGSRTYKVVLRLFRDGLNCTTATNCAELPSSVTIGVYDLSTNAMVGNYRTVPMDQMIDPLPIIASPSCLTNAPQFSYQMGIYSINVTVPSNNNGYTVVYQTCCRVDQIQNISSNNNVGSTYYVNLPGLNRLPIGQVDNSPQFESGISVICYNKPFQLYFGATDSDGDILEYSFTSALNGGLAVASAYNTPAAPPYGSVPYVGVYSAANPFGTNAVINQTTGVISGTAPAPGKYVVGVYVRSYRNGVMINEHYKDFIITVAPCDFSDANLNPTYISCDGFTLNFTNNTVSASNLTFYWEFGDGNVSNIESPTHTYAAAGDYTVKLVVNKGTPCADSATAIAKVYPGFFPGISAPDSVCKNTPVQFSDATTLNYGATNKWKWDFGVTGVSSDTSIIKNPTYTFTQSGTYTVMLQVSSDKGCNKTVTKNIVVMDNAVIRITRDTLICAIDTLQLSASSSTNGTYTWSPNYMISNTGIANPLVSPDVTTTYTVQYADAFGCTGSASVKVNVVNDVSLSVQRDTTICRTDSARILINTNGTNVQWLPNTTLLNGNNTGATVKPINTNTAYTVQSTIGNCRKSATIQVKAVPYPQANAGADTAICFGATAILRGSGGAYYQWSPNTYLANPNTATTTVFPQNSIQYVLSVRDTLGCPKAATDTVNIQVIKVTVDAGPRDTNIVLGQPLQLLATTNGTSVRWTPPTWLNSDTIKNPIANPQQDITYQVIATNAIGCRGTDTIKVHVFRVTADLYIPDAFTPNNDGLNDVFTPIALGIQKLHYFRIYNRLGELVFSTSQIGKGWDGRYKGMPQGTATFVYEASAEDYLGKKIMKKGSVILIR